MLTFVLSITMKPSLIHSIIPKQNLCSIFALKAPVFPFWTEWDYLVSSVIIPQINSTRSGSITISDLTEDGDRNDCSQEDGRNWQKILLNMDFGGFLFLFYVLHRSVRSFSHKYILAFWERNFVPMTNYYLYLTTVHSFEWRIIVVYRERRWIVTSLNVLKCRPPSVSSSGRLVTRP